MATPKPFKTLEKNFVRPVSYFLYPRFLRNRISQITMQRYLAKNPIKYVYTKGNVPLGGRLCIFVSYQPGGILPTTWKYLNHLKEELGYSIVLISNCPLQKQDLPPLQNICHEIIERDNIGVDFGAYKDGAVRYMKKMGEGFNNLETFLIANDSVLGPIYNMKPIHEAMQAEDCDFWGMNDFLEDQNIFQINTRSLPHICSYFICFKNHLLKTDIFKNFWHNMHYPNGRKLAIRTEKKLGQYFLNNKFSYSVFLKKENIIRYIHENARTLDFSLFFNLDAFKIDFKITNPYLYISHCHTNTTCPLFSITHFGMPLMKRDLIKRNVVNMTLFKTILNMYEKQLTEIITKEEILDEIGLNPRTKNSIFKWKKYII